jgi:hypothetical protein
MDIKKRQQEIHSKKGGMPIMKRWIPIIGALMIFTLALGCAEKTVPEKLEIALKPAKGFEETAGTVVINTKTGTDIEIKLTGLKPDGLYTAFFVNVQSLMFEGIGPDPHVLQVNEKGEVNFQGTMKKDIYKKFVQVAIYLNPKGKPIKNPLGVKAALGALIKPEKPKLVLAGKLR